MSYVKQFDENWDNIALAQAKTGKIVNPNHVMYSDDEWKNRVMQLKEQLAYRIEREAREAREAAAPAVSRAASMHDDDDDDDGLDWMRMSGRKIGGKKSRRGSKRSGSKRSGSKRSGSKRSGSNRSGSKRSGGSRCGSRGGSRCGSRGGYRIPGNLWQGNQLSGGSRRRRRGGEPAWMAQKRMEDMELSRQDMQRIQELQRNYPN
jgi:hypothetical protein